jgi:hypothetical protein
VEHEASVPDFGGKARLQHEGTKSIKGSSKSFLYSSNPLFKLGTMKTPHVIFLFVSSLSILASPLTLDDSSQFCAGTSTSPDQGKHCSQSATQPCCVDDSTIANCGPDSTWEVTPCPGNGCCVIGGDGPDGASACLPCK